MKNRRREEEPAPVTLAGRKNRFLIVLPGAALLLLGALIFRDFLFGDAVLLYKDIGADSINDYYPCFLHLSDYIRSEGFPSWSFYVGMGQDLYYLSGYLILQPVTWLHRELIACALVYQHLLKILVAGLFFYHFLRLRGLEWPASLLGSFLLSGSGYMCIGSCWYTLADEVVCFAALLLATEKAVKFGKWSLLALAVALVGLLGSFHLYLCALFLSFYVPARLFARSGWKAGPILRISLCLAGAAVLGVGLGAFITLPHLYALLNSPRGSGTTSFVGTLTSFPLFGLESRLHNLTAALRPFANDALGTGDGFRGWANYLEAPITYCGLLCLVLFPQVFVAASRRHRIIFALFLAGILITTLFPWFRYLFWLFQGDYYRTHSLFSILGLITLAMIAFSRFIQSRPLNLWTLAATTLVLLGVLYLPIDELQSRLLPAIKLQATILLIAYSALLAAGQLMKRQTLFAWIIVGLAAVELIHFDRITIFNRQTVSKLELKARAGYNDETIEAVRDTRAGDTNFFRITKLRPSAPTVWPSLNDAMVFGYYGTSSYSSFNSVNYTNFLTAVGAVPPNSEAETRWSVGLADSALLSAFACEQYLLVPDPVPFQTNPHYEFVKRYSQDYLFRNHLFLPFGLTYSQYMAEDVFLQLSSGYKQEALLRAVVLSNKDVAAKERLSTLAVSALEQDIRTTPLADVVAAQRNTAFKLNSLRQTQIAGDVRLDHKGVVVFQTPFDRGWSAWQNGRATPVLKVDLGLLGVPLDSGEHKLELKYRTPFLIYGVAITLVSSLIFAAGLWRWPRVRLTA